MKVLRKTIIFKPIRTIPSQLEQCLRSCRTSGSSPSYLGMLMSLINSLSILNLNKAIMRLVKDMQVSNRGKSILRKKIQEYKSASPSPEEQETIDSAVFRANQRVLSRTLKERFEEKKHLDIYIRNSFDPVHATWVKKILDPRKLTQTKKVLKISPNSRMNFKDRMRVQQL